MGSKVLGVLGDLVEDVVVWLREPLQQATDTEVEVHRVRGGSAANVAAFAGCPTRFLGSVGADFAGDALVAELSSHGVDVRVQRHGRTGTIVVLIDERGERAMLPDRGASVLLDDVEPSWTAGLAHLHVPAYSFAGGAVREAAIAAVGSVQAEGGSVSLDASSTGMLRHHGVDRFLDLVAELEPDLLLANAAEAELLGLHDVVLAKTTVVVKNGPDPTAVLAPGAAPHHVPVAPVEEVRDLTGAGDAFAAGFLTALLEGAAVETCCTNGHAFAARVLNAPGATMRPA
ncbi:carbohydrate kinase family protein [Saccharopolyspora endophytica]|uniref:carbohydrate kinase family protein n=1 Tax=Saccharopolyspora endophytica TaxID=543886 RepID=UPI001FE5D979|nr:PfkB family carbohydrate kinase [Saccharopolyspora endophytica]